MKTENKQHWDNVYETKSPEQVSWTQEVPETSLALIRSFGLPGNARIIDVGGGDSKLVDCLLEEGFENVTVLDISAKALDKAKKRLGEKADKVRWVVADITEYIPDAPFDVWHDRAAFHFLTGEEQIARYMDTARQSVRGYMAIGTFSVNGPPKCSGLEIKQYDRDGLAAATRNGFELLACHTEDHRTPFGTTQNFLFCSFRRKTDGGNTGA